MTPHLHRKGARIACPFCVRPTERRECPRITGGISPARRADKKEKTYGFPLLANHPLSLRRATGAVDRCSAKRLPPTCCCDRHGMAATPEGAKISPLAACEKWAAILSRNAPLRASARPYLRHQMPQIFGQTPLCLLTPKEKGVIRKRGETFGVSPLVRLRRAAALPPAGGGHSVSPCQAKKPSLYGAGGAGLFVRPSR